MKDESKAYLTWKCVADFEPDERLDHHVRHEAQRLSRLSMAQGRGTHQLLVNLRRLDEHRYEAELTCRHGDVVFHHGDRAPDPVTAFELSSAKLEEDLERRSRYDRKRRRARRDQLDEPVELTGPDAPLTPEDVVKGMAVDYLGRLRHYVRRRLRSETIVHPDWPITAISDGEVVDEAILRMIPKHPSSIPWGAFWPWAIDVCEQVLGEFLEEAGKAAQSLVSLDEDLPDAGEWDAGYDVERPYDIIERILTPGEDEVADATPDERAAAPSTIAEYEDFLAYLQQVLADWPEPEKRLVELYCFEGLHPHEIAAMEECDEAEIMAALGKALPKLRQVMVDTPAKRT